MSRTSYITIIILIFSHSIYAITRDNEIYNLLVKFGQLYSSGDLINAEVCLLKIIDSEEVVSEDYLVATYNNLGSVNRLLGRYNKALEYYQLAEDIVISKSKYSGYLADIYINIGGIYSLKSTFPESIKYFEKAIRIYYRINEPDIRIFQNISTGYMNLGLTYYKIGDYKQAMENLQKSSDLKLKMNLSEKELTYLNIAKVYAHTGDHLNAETFFLKSIKEFKNEYEPNYYRITSVYFDYGLFLSSTGREEESHKYYQRALDICLRTYSNKHPFVSLAYKHIGDHYLESADYDSALINYQKALTTGVQDFNNMDINTNPIPDSVLLDEDMIRCLQKKSETLMLFALRQDKFELRKQLMEQSIETSEVILDLIFKVRNNLKSEESRLYLADNEKETYFFATETAHQLFLLTKDPMYVQKMYRTVLLGKAAVISKGISENLFFQSSMFPVDYQQKQNNLKTDIAAYESLILNESRKKNPDRKKLDFWKDVLFELNIEKKESDDLFFHEHPQYKDLFSKTKSTTIGDIQRHLGKDESVIDYLLSKHYSQGKRKIYIFLITKECLEYKEIYLDSLFISNVNIISNSHLNITAGAESADSFVNYTTALFYMYNNLIKPVKELINGNRLIIIPDEEIGTLPFDAFLKSKPVPGQRDFEGLQFLINDYSFSFGYSALLLLREDPVLRREALTNAFLPDYKNTGIPGIEPSNIQGTNAEIDAISQLFKLKKFSGSMATETNFREATQQPAIFHLAMHSLADSANSRYSYLLFETLSDNRNDGKLYNYEINIGKIASPMVVLSTCNSGTGTLFHGEGLMSLAREFFLSGASSVIKTAWEVNDETSAAIISRFYFYLSKGKPKDIALRLAKLEYIKTSTPIYGSPYYWASYEVLGNNEPIVNNTLNKELIITFTVIILTAGLFLYYRKRLSIFFDRSE